jgi:type I restriction enzyme S subunit
VSLREVTCNIGSGATPRGGERSYKESGTSLVRSQNVYDFQFVPDGLAFINEEQAAQLSNVEVKPQDLLLNITGHSVGRCCIVPEEYLPARVNQHVAIIRVNQKADARYLLCYINSPRNKTRLLNQVHGGTRKALTKGILEDFKIEIPPLSIQCRIADILGALDDKIDVNRRINRTLEAMAGALYKHWFVDFGPFQDGEFVESELGLIPEGWTIGAVEDLMELAYGKGLPAKKRIPGRYPVFGSSGQVGTHNEYLVKGPGIIVGRKGTIGRLSWARENFWPIDTTYYVVPRREAHSLEYLYHVLGSLELEKRNSDSAVPGLNRNDTYTLPLVLPPDEVLGRFNGIVRPWFRQVEVNKREIEMLVQTRDYLLPRLLSGEIPVEVGEEAIVRADRE